MSFLSNKFLPIKAHYFFISAGTAPVVTFLTTYARQLGFTPVTVGSVFQICLLFCMFAKPLVGVIADRFRRLKFIFLLFQGLILTTFIAWFLIPHLPSSTKVRLDCSSETYIVACDSVDPQAVVEVLEKSNENTTVYCDLQCDVNGTAMTDICQRWHIPQYCAHRINKSLAPAVDTPTHLGFTAALSMQHTDKEGDCTYMRVQMAKMLDGSPHVPFCNELEHFQCSAYCNDPSVMKMIGKPAFTDVTKTYQFWMFLLILAIMWTSMSVVGSVGDTICFGILGEQTHLYGHQRLWGAVGWGAFSFITGVLIDEFSRGKAEKDYSIAFYLCLVNICLSLLVSQKLECPQVNISRNIFRDVGIVFLDIRIMMFTLWCLLIGMNTALIWNYLFWYLEELYANQGPWMKVLQGSVTAIQCVLGELPLFFLSGWIIKSLGHVNVMTVVLLGFSARFFLYAIISNPWWFLPVELLAGITFGLFYPTMVSYANIIAPPGTETTVQSIVATVFEQIGVGLGSLFGSLLLQYYSGAVMFEIFGLVTFFFAVLHATFYMIMSRSSILPHNKGVVTAARYAAPNDAVDMLGDQEMLTR